MKTVVFDKTGTLTLGRPKVVSVVLFSNFSMAELCHVAMAIEVSAVFWIPYQGFIDFSRISHEKHSNEMLETKLIYLLMVGGGGRSLSL